MSSHLSKLIIFTTTKMANINKRDGRETVIVVLDGMKVVTDKTGVSPLRCALRDVVGPSDEVLVLTILVLEAPMPSPSPSYCCIVDNRCNHPALGEGDYDIKYLQQEINKRKEAYMQMFRSYYDACKSNGVKFQVKIAASFHPKPIIEEEANNVKATWIVMDGCFARAQNFGLSGTHCNISVVSGDEEAVVHNYLPQNDTSELPSSVKELKSNPKLSKKKKKALAQEGPHVHYTLPNFEGEYQHLPPSLVTSTSKGIEILTMAESSEETQSIKEVELPTKGAVSLANIPPTEFSEVNLFQTMPLQLSWDVISDSTGGFQNIICFNQNESFKMYGGYLPDTPHSCVLVKRFNGDFSGILEAEIKAASSIYHKNIMRLLGYHQSEKDTILVFPNTPRGTLDLFLNGSRGKHVELSFEEKMKIAIGIAQGIRYMHEECPRGPVVHGDLRPCHIHLRSNSQPLISGFGKATWLQLERASPILYDRSMASHKDPSDNDLVALVKSDILSFGIMLLRLFCRRSAPQNDKILVEWARPLLLQRAYHKLLDEDTGYLDIYGIYRVMSAAAQCTKTKPTSRPCMSEVISLLRGETSCAVQSSPSSEGSPNLDSNVWLK